MAARAPLTRWLPRQSYASLALWPIVIIRIISLMISFQLRSLLILLARTHEMVTRNVEALQAHQQRFAATGAV